MFAMKTTVGRNETGGNVQHSTSELSKWAVMRGMRPHYSTASGGRLWGQFSALQVLAGYLIFTTKGVNNNSYSLNKNI